MHIARSNRIILAGLAAGLVAALAQAPAGAGPAPLPLAIVGPDTLTTTELKIELGIMENQRPDGAQSSLPNSDDVLRRLIQNRLVMQEGYRMGLDQEFVVSNQVVEFVRHKTMTTLLDSVSTSVPADSPDIHEARRLAVFNYLADLNERYHVTVDSTLLASLDYGSTDPAVQKYLREDETVLAVVPTGRLTVAGFSRILRFTEYHGLVGKENADDKRDKAFRKWLSEAVLNHQAKLQHIADMPRFATMARRYEETLVLQEALRLLLTFDFKPSEDEVQKYWQQNPDKFSPAPRVRMESLKVASHTAAADLRRQMMEGAPVSWLKGNVAAVIQGPAPFPAEFFEPSKLGLKAEEMKVGWVPEPYQVPSGWVVARVQEIEEPAPTPLASCRDAVLANLKAEQTRELMTSIIAQLEEATPVTVMPDAKSIVTEVIAEFGRRTALESAGEPGSETPSTSPSQEG